MPWTHFLSATGRFDVVVVHNRHGRLASHLQRGSQALGECRRVLRSGGRVVVIERGAVSGLKALFQPRTGFRSDGDHRWNARSGRFSRSSIARRPRRLSFRRRTESGVTARAGDLLEGHALVRPRVPSRLRPESRPIGGKGFALHGSASMQLELDVFTADEIARAAGVPREAIQRLVDAGTLKPVPGSAYFDTRTAVRAALRARRETAGMQPGGPGPFRHGHARGEGRFGLASSLLHGAALALLVWTTSGAVDIGATTPRERLVFLGAPGARRWRRGRRPSSASARQAN